MENVVRFTADHPAILVLIVVALIVVPISQGAVINPEPLFKAIFKLLLGGVL